MRIYVTSIFFTMTELRSRWVYWQLSKYYFTSND